MNTHPKSIQVEAILARVAGSLDSKLRKLHCGYLRPVMSGMDPKTLSEALMKLETVGGLSTGQVLSLFSQISEYPDLRLSELRRRSEDQN